MLKELLITLATSAVVFTPFSARASELGDRQDDFISTVESLLTGPVGDFSDDTLALKIIQTTPSAQNLVIRFAVDYCLAKAKGEEKQEDQNQIQRIDRSMTRNGTPDLKRAFRSLYIAASVVANKRMCP
jgi:hypothetical protein